MWCRMAISCILGLMYKPLASKGEKELKKVCWLYPTDLFVLFKMKSYSYSLLSWIFCLGSFVLDLLSWIFCLESFVLNLLSWIFCLGSFVLDLLSWIFCLGSWIYFLRLIVFVTPLIVKVALASLVPSP